MQGFTLIEIMVVLAIVALMVAGGRCRGFDRCARRTCASRRRNLSGAMRYLFDRASTTGKIHRLVIDMETGMYWAEVSDDRFFIPREAESEQACARARTRRRRRTRTRRRSASARARSRERQERARQLQLRPVEAGGRRLPAQARALRVVQGPGAQAGEAQEDEGPQRLHAARHRAADQRARLHLLLPARADRARDHHAVATPTGDAIYSLVVHPITGRVRIYNQEVQPPARARTAPTTKASRCSHEARGRRSGLHAAGDHGRGRDPVGDAGRAARRS